MHRLLLCLLITFSSLAGFAQLEDSGSSIDIPGYKNSFFTGGNLGLQFGSVVLIDASPQFGYYPLEHLSVGTGFTYQYISDRRMTPRLDVNVYGGRLFTRLYLPVFESLFAHIEYEYMTYKTNITNLGSAPEWIQLNNFLAGAGYRQPVGGRSSINLTVLWNFNESLNTLYTNPIIRVGADIGL